MNFNVGDFFRPGRISNDHYRITAQKNRAVLKVVDVGHLGMLVKVLEGVDGVGTMHWVNPEYFSDSIKLSAVSKGFVDEEVPKDLFGGSLRIVSARRKVVYL